MLRNLFNTLTVSKPYIYPYLNPKVSYVDNNLHTQFILNDAICFPDSRI